MRTVIISVFCHFLVCARGQDTTGFRSLNLKTGFSLEYTEQNMKLMSVGGSFIAQTGPKRWVTSGLCLEASLSSNNLVLMPRVYVEEIFNWFAVRLNVANIIRDQRTFIYLIPELGITYKGRMSLYFGYGVNHSDNSHFDRLAPMRLTLSFRFVAP